MWTPLGPDTGGGADGVAFVLPGGRGACTEEVLGEYRLHGTFIGLGCLLYGSLTFFGLWTGLALAMGEEMMRLGDDFFARYAPAAFRRMAKVRALTPASPIWTANTTGEEDDPHHLVCDELGENVRRPLLDDRNRTLTNTAQLAEAGGIHIALLLPMLL